MFDPVEYSILVRREVVDGEAVFVARVAELPDLKEYADSYQEAYGLAVDAIETAQRICDEQGIAFPAPRLSTEDVEYNGRISVRISKSLHRDIHIAAVADGLSLSAYVSQALERMVRVRDFKEIISEQLSDSRNLRIPVVFGIRNILDFYSSAVSSAIPGFNSSRKGEYQLLQGLIGGVAYGEEPDDSGDAEWVGVRRMITSMPDSLKSMGSR